MDFFSRQGCQFQAACFISDRVYSCGGEKKNRRIMTFHQSNRDPITGRPEQKNRRQAEILSPAGSYDSFRAALISGADAVYAGGPCFGARAYADNFTEEQLCLAIDEAHFHGRRFYLTVNTLLKKAEFPQLFSFLEPLYRRGLDAVIVQDIGVFYEIRRRFPDLDIHASTQMTITGAEGARFLQECGAVRVVPARELSLEEIRHIKRETGMEIECFVHGALCYCYSGQCLLSSMIGGRSGNRGQCAQPCRLPYTAEGEKGYLLSLKDICTLELIPDLIEAGIDSFKIEGRMKRPEYVAGVTSIYRKYVDLYQSTGRKGFRVAEEDKEILLDLYNRGGFHSGYYQQKNGREMMALKRPNHAGVPAVKIKNRNGREITVQALTEIHKGDVLDLSLEKYTDYTFGEDYKRGTTAKILVPRGMELKKDCILYRVKNQRLLTQLQDALESEKIQEKIYGFLSLPLERPATLLVGQGKITAEAVSDLPVERAEKSPLDEMRVRRQIMKTGNTEFLFESLEIEMEEGVFLPMQQLNVLRRNALEQLRRKICESFYRENGMLQKEFTDRYLPSGFPLTDARQEKPPAPVPVSVLVETMAQLEAASDFPEVSRIYIDSALDGNLFDQELPAELLEKLRKQKTELYLAMPHIFRKKTRDLFEDRKECLSAWHFEGALLRNYESYMYWKTSLEKEELGFDKNVILDHNLYVMNPSAKAFWISRGVERFTVPMELNRQEIADLGAEDMEMLVYGYVPVMISAQCLTNTVKGCKKQSRDLTLIDRYQNRFPTKKRCRDCYQILYNPIPLYLLDEKAAVEKLCPSFVRLQFSVEDAGETRRILEEWRRSLTEGHGVSKQRPEHFTHGHFRRGIR